MITMLMTVMQILPMTCIRSLRVVSAAGSRKKLMVETVGWSECIAGRPTLLLQLLSADDEVMSAGRL